MQLLESLAMSLDPVVTARRVGVDPDPWQAELLRARARQMLLLCARQAGKSTASALLAVDEAVFHAPALVLILAPALRQAKLVFATVKKYLDRLGPSVAPYHRETALTLELRNGSIIECLPGVERTVRGFSAASLIVLDEAARISDPLYIAVRPMLAVSGGRIILLSTPWGRRGAFHEEWETGEGWTRVKHTAYDNPRISPAWLEEERRRIGPRAFAQEYLCEFVEVEDQVFTYESVQRAMTDEFPPLFAPSAA